MKLKDARDAYYDYTKQVSESTQLLALAGIGVIWVLRVDKASEAITSNLLVPVLLFSGSLACHLLHYIAATLSWGGYHHHKEAQKDVNESTKFLAPPWINWPGNTFFIGKVLLVIAGYSALGRYGISLFR